LYHTPLLEREADIAIANIKLEIPTTDKERYAISEYSVTLLFAVLPKRDLLRLLCAILIEEKILFLSKNLRKLSSVIVSFIAFLYPLKYQSILAPVVPEALSSIVEVSAPYIVGMPFTPATDSLRPTGVITVNLDTRKTIIPPSVLLPELPEHTELLNNIKHFGQKLRASKLPYVPDKSCIEMAQNVVTEINKYIVSHVLNIKAHCITNVSDGISVFGADRFMKAQEEQNIPFFKRFFKTKIAKKYLEEYLENMDSVTTNPDFVNLNFGENISAVAENK